MEEQLSIIGLIKEYWHIGLAIWFLACLIAPLLFPRGDEDD